MIQEGIGDPADITDTLPLCQQCEKVLPNFDLVMCSPECEAAWQAEQAEQEEELEHQEAARYEDPNAGCWSYSW